MAIHDASSASWSAGEVFTHRRTFQNKGDATISILGTIPGEESDPVSNDDGVDLLTGDSMTFDKGLKVFWRKASTAPDAKLTSTAGAPY